MNGIFKAFFESVSQKTRACTLCIPLFSVPAPPRRCMQRMGNFTRTIKSHHKQSNGHAESNIKKVKKLLEIHNGVYSKEYESNMIIIRFLKKNFQV